VKEKYFKTKYKPVGMLLKFLRYLFQILRTHRKISGQLSAQANFSYNCDFPDLEYTYLPESVAARPFMDDKMADFSK
jgi:hypothetical protein